MIFLVFHTVSTSIKRFTHVSIYGDCEPVHSQVTVLIQNIDDRENGIIDV